MNLNQFFRRINSITVICAFLLTPCLLIAQQNQNDSIIQPVTLEDCIHYAIKHNPDLQNARINEAITETAIKIKLADWYPQIDFSANLQHNYQLPNIFFNGGIVQSGAKNTSVLQFNASQNIFNQDALLASRSAKDVRLQAKQNTKEQNINIAVMVSKTFYSLILTVQQLKLSEEAIVRLEQSYKDAFYQYQSGIVDKTDYKMASISLNNAKAQKKFGEESLKAIYASLKQLMGFPNKNKIELVYDTTKMEQEIFLDTLQNVDYNHRIEIQLLQTQKKLQQYNLQYYKWSYLPDVSAFGNYTRNFLNNQFSKLYNEAYPNSYLGIVLTVPIFQGGKRVQEIKEAKLQITQVDNSILSYKNQIDTQYQHALSTYKSNLYDYYSLKENMALANEVYDIISLQYRSGVKTYLDVITAETDLRTAQINYYNALYQVLSSKIDVAQALGNITY